MSDLPVRHSREGGNPHDLITEHLDIWTSAIKAKSAPGRGSSKKLELVGVKKLRELILELAVRGKLVPQDPNDEPASELLKKIEAEKVRLLKEGKIKKQKNLPPIADEEKPFELTKGWEWVRFQDVCEYIQRGKGPKYSEFGMVKVISQKCVQWNGFNLDAARYVDDQSLTQYQAERFLQNNDLLWNSTGTGTAGRINLLKKNENDKLVADSHVTVIRTLVKNAGFICNYISSIGIQKRIQSGVENTLVSGTTNQVELNTSVVINLPIPVPPLEEQHRIVAKVDELMILCDQLEAQTESSIQAHQLLVETLLATLSNAKDADELNDNWQRISQHFDVLFTTQDSIDQLKQTILQLAVMGKLVKQDPNDEPAAKLLERIATEKQQLIKDGKIKKQKPLPEISDEEKSFELPDGWEWIKLDDLSTKSGAGWSPQCRGYPRASGNWGVLKVSAVSWGKYNPEENKELPDALSPRPEYEVNPGDFLISRANTAELVAKAVVVPEDTPRKLMMSDKIIRFNFSSFINLDFIQLVNNSSQARSYYGAVAGGTSSSMKNVSREQIRNLVFALPSSNEQYRIVTKVGELMALCDSLKDRLDQAQTTQLHLTDAIVEQA
jgi:type I restriction enzyme S subunit